MPRAPKKAKMKPARNSTDEPSNGTPAEMNPAEVAVEEPRPAEDYRPSGATPESRNAPAEAPLAAPPKKREEPAAQQKLAPKGARQKEEPHPTDDKDHIAATSLNIAKLQSLSMTELNQLARELSVENFGTMRKHEVIFHILQKNA
jgi:transcription termination factor Rho